jgi:hypothetical protein
MNTVTDNIVNELELLEKDLRQFLTNHSGIERIIFPHDNIISASGDYSFKKLKPEAIGLQDQLYKSFNRIFNLIEILLSDSPSKHLKTLKNCRKQIERIILQNQMTWSDSVSKAIDSSAKNFIDIKELLLTLFPKSQEWPILVIDTNAFYSNTDFEKWVFSEFQRFELIITPSVLRDLDKHKIEHRNESIRKKAITTHASRAVMANLAQIRIATESAMDTRIFVTAGRSFARVPRP